MVVAQPEQLNHMYLHSATVKWRLGLFGGVVVLAISLKLVMFHDLARLGVAGMKTLSQSWKMALASYLPI